MSLIRAFKPKPGRRLFLGAGIIAAVILIALGVFASNGWLPRTDAMTGKKFGWFGKELPRNAASSWNPFAAPLPSPSPSLSKEYIRSGSRLLAVEDKNASAVPPTDLAVWRPTTGTWYVLGGQGSQQINFNWGISGDLPIPADFDGDGKTDFSIFRPSTGQWWVNKSSDGTTYVVSWGIPCQEKSCDYAVPADFDGDGKSDFAVWRPEDRVFYVMQSGNNNSVVYQQWGNVGDVPVPADFDGDGKADYAVFRPEANASFHSKNSSNGQTLIVNWGTTADKPRPADYDGDGKADHTVWRPSNGTWYGVKSSNSQTYTLQWGQLGDVPVTNDYDADGKCDHAVWRPPPGGETKEYGVWWIKNSSNSPPDRIVGWGLYGDIPVPAFYRR